ncbi:hypothetical protein M404DRAFT_848282 [Pisolithus tinctorius Marx 270]|uniref:Uncharacterized protein n=1 Tax=Pisolithus tinctorius Marx 270 TaxID=870435 RepID=A0A0C3NTG6_PISTI|nr:hypothetical protein M404DRAFT_848282 [Pisolithus tinctorius Marx 270]
MDSPSSAKRSNYSIYFGQFLNCSRTRCSTAFSADQRRPHYDILVRFFSGSILLPKSRGPGPARVVSPEDLSLVVHTKHSQILLLALDVERHGLIRLTLHAYPPSLCTRRVARPYVGVTRR